MEINDTQTLFEEMKVGYTTICGDCIDTLGNIESGSVHCCVTSPPYWGLRDYGVDGQLGMEETPGEYVDKMVDVFREVRRVLRDDGTLWLNLGDSYNAYNHNHGAASGANKNNHNVMPKSAKGLSCGSLKNKDLVGIPWRVAFALQLDGWYLRQDIIWHKSNPMPESVRDRCTKAHEYIFLMSKSARYYYDHVAIKEPAVGDKPGNKTHKGKTAYDKGDRHHRTKAGLVDMKAVTTRNKRSVWTVTTKSYKEAHFATFPPDLIRPCIMAGCPQGGTVLDPFGGSGTTAEVAMKHGCNAILCELNPDYITLQRKRLSDFNEVMTL